MSLKVTKQHGSDILIEGDTPVEVIDRIIASMIRCGNCGTLIDGKDVIFNVKSEDIIPTDDGDDVIAKADVDCPNCKATLLVFSYNPPVDDKAKALIQEADKIAEGFLQMKQPKGG